MSMNIYAQVYWLGTWQQGNPKLDPHLSGKMLQYDVMAEALVGITKYESRLTRHHAVF